MEMLDISRRDIARHLGYKRPEDLDDITAARIEECVKEVTDVAEYQSIHHTFPIIWEEELCEFAGIKIHSKDLLKNLKGCSEAIMLAVTIGPAVDRLIRRAEVTDVSKAVILQAVGAEVVEAWCNKVNLDIKNDMAAKGCSTKPRFSPGYGDLPLELQQEFERVLQMRKNIGISLSDSNIMTPSKSITAVIGISYNN